MKITRIECDNCFKILHAKHIRIKSAEIRFNKQKFSPIVLDGRNTSIHFCSAKCLSAYFKDKLLTAK